jgi:hypothetical protein
MTCVAMTLPAATRAATFTVNSPSDKIDIQPGDGVCATLEHTCTLRAAIFEANALPGPDTIIVPPGRYALRIDGGNEDAGVTGDLDITDDLIINGAGETTTIIDGNFIDRVFDVHSPAQVTLSNMTITNGQPRGAPGVEYDAGGMLNAGTVTLSNITFLRNRAGFYGGSVGGLENDGTATLTHVTFVQNHAADERLTDGFSAGSIGGMYNRGTATLTDVTFHGNRATVTVTPAPWKTTATQP